jgi:hypothetical protein
MALPAPIPILVAPLAVVIPFTHARNAAIIMILIAAINPARDHFVSNKTKRELS